MNNLPILDILDQAYQSKSSDQNQAMLSNMYLEMDPAKGKYKIIALPTPGLTEFCDTGESVVRAMYALNGVLYAIAGNTFFSITNLGVMTAIGTLNTSSGFAKIRAINGAADGNHQVVMIDGTNGYSYNIGTQVFQTLTTNTFVSQADVVNSGVNYTNPTLTVSDATGTGTTLSAIVDAGQGQITSIQIVNPGSGYTAPTVVITDSTGANAAATAIITGGTITSIQLTASGNSYTNPTVSFIGDAGTGATATALILGGAITGVNVLIAGSNYTSPTVTVTDTTGSGAVISLLTTASSFPNTAIDIENQDDYIIVALSNSQEFQISNVADSTTWDPLNFASKEGQPDNIQAVLSHEGRIWFFGSKTTETWLDSGNALFPFQRDSSTFLHYGCVALESIAVNGNYFIFLSSNGLGGYSVLQTLPRIYYYNPAPISNPFVDTKLGQLATITDVKAWIYNKDGHEFYEMTSPSGNATLFYDIPKKQQADQEKGAWYIRTSYANGVYGRFLGNCQSFCYNLNLVGDFNSGKIYYQDDSNYTENGVAIQRQFISSPGGTYQGGKRVNFSRLQIDVETGIGSEETFTVEKSGDNGETWIALGTYTVPQKGGRIFITRVGSSRYGMIFRVTTTMNAKFIILGFQVEAEVCDN